MRQNRRKNRKTILRKKRIDSLGADIGFGRCLLPVFFYFWDFLITPMPENGIPDNNAFQRFAEMRSHTECDLEGLGKLPTSAQMGEASICALLAEL